MLILFTIGVLLYTLGVCIAALCGNVKAKQRLQGRLRQMREYRIRRKAKLPMSSGDGDWIWFHAASLGEFEQGRPVIEAIKQAHPEFKILLSFFFIMAPHFFIYLNSIFRFFSYSTPQFGDVPIGVSITEA